MKTGKIARLATTSGLTLSFLTASCDRTVSYTETEKVKRDGAVDRSEWMAAESSEGTIKKEDKKSLETS